MLYEQQQQVRSDLRRNTGTAGQRKRGTAIFEEDERLEVVDLSGLLMESLPNPILNLALICKLDLSKNNLQIIPESLVARLLNVVVLDVHSNQLKVLPNSIGCLTKLKVLNVAGNYLQTLPRTIENCRSLEELNANFNQLMRLPDTIGFELLNLKKLSISSNKLVFLPHSISHLTSLRILDARLNCLRSLPADMENLIKLEVLNVSQNFQCLETLPYSIGLLLSLVELDVSYNKITALPDSMGCLQRSRSSALKETRSLHLRWKSLSKVACRERVLEHKMNAGHQSPAKKKSWICKLIRYSTFNGSD
ncbi:hypothetical protein BT93_C0057 [Corymbia citriodora subsp. variegata]|nr:hypothetical protein BT93_C0057 [Corymbia citriodora subsp. variegata]